MISSLQLREGSETEEELDPDEQLFHDFKTKFLAALHRSQIRKANHSLRKRSRSASRQSISARAPSRSRQSSSGYVAYSQSDDLMKHKSSSGYVPFKDEVVPYYGIHPDMDPFVPFASTDSNAEYSAFSYHYLIFTSQVR